MAPKRARDAPGTAGFSAASVWFLPASSVSNEEGLEKIRRLMASATNKWGASRAWCVKVGGEERPTTAFPVFMHSIAAGLIPPFSPFLLAILENYCIQLLHLHPRSVTLLAASAYWCEAFVGVMPSLALFRHFFCVRVLSPDDRLGGVGFFADDGEGFLPLSILRVASEFRRDQESNDSLENQIIMWIKIIIILCQ